MFVKVIRVDGVDEALFGLGLSYGITSSMTIDTFRHTPEVYQRMERVACRLAHKGKGHSKFLESISIWLDVRAPRYWWSEMDTYRVAVTKQSESTMHTILKRPLSQEDFERPIDPMYLDLLNAYIDEKMDIAQVKNGLPEGFLQRRIICTNAKSVQHMIEQRRGHKLCAWRTFIDGVLTGWERLGLNRSWLVQEEG